MNLSQENTGYNFDSDETFEWSSKDRDELRYLKIRHSLASLKDLLATRSYDEDPEDTILLTVMSDVIDSLERTFVHHFQTRTGHVVSPKSIEPWD